jgi:succinoglycan biosynthesis transport protein ExoP
VSQTIEEERPNLLGQSLRRFSVVVLLLAVLGGVAATAYAASLPRSYTSSARILLRPSTGNPYSVETGPSSQQVTIAMTTESALVDSDPVLKLVNAKLSPALKASAVTVNVPPNTSTIVATVRAGTAQRAQQGAQAVADGYLQYRTNVSLKTRQSSSDQLNGQIDTVKKNLAKASAAAASQSTDSQAARSAQVLTEQLISLQDLLNTAESIDPNPGTLVSPASEAARSGISSLVYTVAGVIAGLMLGMAAALWLGRRDHRVHASSGAAVSGVPVLAVLGAQRRRRGRRTDRDEADRQAYQRLRTAVLASSALPSAVAVSGVSPDDTSTPVALELGRSMTRAGYRVVLVMATAEESGPFTGDSRGARGLSDVLREGRSPTALLVEHEGLTVLPAGSGILQQQELLSGARFADIVTDLKASFDYVLVVTGPAVLPAELATARLADGLLLVGRDGVTSRLDIADVAARARLVSLRITGMVLRGREARTASSKRDSTDQSAGSEAASEASSRNGRASGTPSLHPVDDLKSARR